MLRCGRRLDQTVLFHQIGQIYNSSESWTKYCMPHCFYKKPHNIHVFTWGWVDNYCVLSLARLKMLNILIIRAPGILQRAIDSPESGSMWWDQPRGTNQRKKLSRQRLSKLFFLQIIFVLTYSRGKYEWYEYIIFLCGILQISYHQKLFVGCCVPWDVTLLCFDLSLFLVKGKWNNKQK